MNVNAPSSAALTSLRHPALPAASTLAAMLMSPAVTRAATDTHRDLAFADTSDEVTQLDPLTIEDHREKSLASPKFTQPLVDTPQTITVIPRTVFEQQGANSLRDVLRNTPGITFAAGEGGTPAGDQMTIRGFDARTDITIDGVRDAGTYTRDSFNIEQVEVAKGPSSTAVGRGSTGANVNLVTKTPHADTFRQSTLGLGNADYRRATLDDNESLSSLPHAAVRLNALWQESGVPGRDLVENRQWAVAPSLALGLGTGTRVTASYLHAEQHNLPDYGLPWNLLGVVDPSNWYGLLDRDFEDITNDAASLSVERDLAPGTTLRNFTRYGATDRLTVVTPPRLVDNNDPAQGVRRNDVKTRDQRNQSFANQTNLVTSLATGAVRHEVSAGLELSWEKVDRPTLATDPAAVHPVTDAYSADPYQPFPWVYTRTGDITSGTAKDLALYVFDTATLTPKLELTGGLRWDYLDTDSATYTAATDTTARLGRIDRIFSWKGALVFKPRPTASLYLGYGTSFNPSAEDLAFSSGSSRSPRNDNVGPEKNRSIELGTKWELLRRRLLLTSSLFQTEKTNARVSDPTDPTQAILAGDQRVRGVELGATGYLTDAWSLFAGYTFLDSEILDSTTAAELGASLARTPKNSATLWTTYALPFRLTLGAGAQYQSEVNRSTTDATLVVPAYWLFNAMASWQANRHVTLRLNVNNLTDKSYVDLVGGGHYVPGPRRSVQLTATLRF